VEIKRDYYLDKLIAKKHNGLIKIITGIRRCGKSYLMNNLFFEHLKAEGVPAKNIIRFAFDSADDLALIGEDLIELEVQNRPVDPQKFLKYIKSKVKSEDKMYYLLLDEVQLLGNFEAVLNGYLRKKNMDVYVSGSNARFLSSDIVTEFAGRGDVVQMYPLSFAEFMQVSQKEKYDALNEYMLYGGIPLVALQEDPAEKEAMLKNLFDEIYVRDIVKRNKIRNIGEFEDLLNVLSSAVGSYTNPEKLKNTFHSKKNSKITTGTIRKYIAALEDSFLVESASRYDIKGKSYIGTPLKYYFTDSGLRNARLGFRQIEETHLMENVVFNELKRRGLQVDVGVVTVSEKVGGKSKRKNLEVDFICNRGSKRCYIQSAFAIPDEEKRKQETASLIKINDSFKKIIVVKDGISGWYTEEGIHVVNIFDFLLNPDVLNM